MLMETEHWMILCLLVAASAFATLWLLCACKLSKQADEKIEKLRQRKMLEMLRDGRSGVQHQPERANPLCGVCRGKGWACHISGERSPCFACTPEAHRRWGMKAQRYDYDKTI